MIARRILFSEMPAMCVLLDVVAWVIQGSRNRGGGGVVGFEREDREGFVGGGAGTERRERGGGRRWKGVGGRG